MANRFNFQYTMQLLGGNIVERQLARKALGDCRETFWNEAMIDAGVEGPTAVRLGLGSITNPKMLIVIGDKGISFTLNASTEVHEADPICILSNSAGFAVTPAEIVVSNSDTQPPTVVVIAVE